MRSVFLLPFLPLVMGCPLSAGEPAPAARPDKSSYNLFNPTPRAQMRELSTDRPDTTESPYTVDAGHVQVEMSFVDYTRNRVNGGREERYTIAPVNMKLGLLNNTDIQVVFDPYRIERRPGEDKIDGVGNTQIRLKVNVWGNDGGKTAFGLMPFVQLPTAAKVFGERKTEGGLIAVFAAELPAGFGMGAMAELDIVPHEEGGYGTEFVHTVTLSHDLIGDLGGYVEYIGVAPSESEDEYQAQLGGGLTFALSDDIQLDAGANFGLNDAADDLNLFTGISLRF